MQIKTDVPLHRRILNHWIGRSHSTAHLALGVLFAGCYAAGSLLESSAPESAALLLESSATESTALLLESSATGSAALLLANRLHMTGFYGLLLHLLLVFLHTNIHGTNRFLNRFRETSHLPVRQLQQVSSFSMLLFLAAAAWSMAGGAWLVPTVWTQVLLWFSRRQKTVSPAPDFVPMPDKGMEAPDLAALAAKTGKTPSWLPLLEAVLAAAEVLFTAALLFLLLYHLARWCCALLRRFCSWDDDEKIFLKPSLLRTDPHKTKKHAETTRRFRMFHRTGSCREAIRRHYRRTIRSCLKKQKLQPEPWASPKELEAAAHCSSHTFHQLYEKARYSRNECTRKDLETIIRETV